MYQPDPEDYAVAEQEFAGIEKQRRKLRARAGLDPRDPEALDEDELQQLEELEQWQP